jgi:hypothetical protein
MQVCTVMQTSVVNFSSYKSGDILLLSVHNTALNFIRAFGLASTRHS